MWLIDFYKMWNWGGRIGLIGGLIGFIAAFMVAPIPALFMFTIIFGVFYFVFKGIFYPEVEARRLRQIGQDATATILEVKETGWTVNKIYYIVNFVLEVRPKDRPAYQANLRRMISRLTMAKFQVGAVIPVKFDPNNPQKVTLIESTQALPQEANATAPISTDQMKEVGAMIAKRDAMNKELLAKGEEAEATILRAWEMGIRVNGDNPFMGFLLEVRPNNQPVFTAEAQAPIMRANVPKYQPGRNIHVRFDPNDQTRVTLEQAL